MRKTLLGWIALAMIAASAAILAFVKNPDATTTQIQGACLRVGLVLGAWRLAYDELLRLPKWLIWIVPGAVLLAASTKRFLPVVGVLIIVAFLLKLGALTKR